MLLMKLCHQGPRRLKSELQEKRSVISEKVHENVATATTALVKRIVLFTENKKSSFFTHKRKSVCDTFFPFFYGKSLEYE